VKDIIIVSKGGGVFEPRDIVVGVDTGDGYLQILEGIKPDEEVVTSAQFLIDSESKLREAVEKMRERKLEVKTKIPTTEPKQEVIKIPEHKGHEIPTTEHKH
jgi:hypothetical protein